MTMSIIKIFILWKEVHDPSESFNSIILPNSSFLKNISIFGIVANFLEIHSYLKMNYDDIEYNNEF